MHPNNGCKRKSSLSILNNSPSYFSSKRGSVTLASPKTSYSTSTFISSFIHQHPSNSDNPLVMMHHYNNNYKTLLILIFYALIAMMTMTSINCWTLPLPYQQGWNALSLPHTHPSMPINSPVTQPEGASRLLLFHDGSWRKNLQSEVKGNGSGNATMTDELSADAMNRLLRVFGMEDHAERRGRHSSPPQFMLDLYNSIADSKSGIITTGNHAIRYNAKIVRSFADRGMRDSTHHLHFHFNLSGIPTSEQISEAELHLYKIKPKVKVAEKIKDPRYNLLEVRIYQVMSPKNLHSPEGNRLLDVRRMSTFSVGWEVFYVKEAVLDWINDENTNYGLLITARSILNAKVDNGVLRFSKRHQHHVNKQPILVLFSGGANVVQTQHAVSDLDAHDYGYSEVFHNTKTNTQTHLMHSSMSLENVTVNYKDGNVDKKMKRRAVRSATNGIFEHDSYGRRDDGMHARNSYGKSTTRERDSLSYSSSSITSPTSKSSHQHHQQHHQQQQHGHGHGRHSSTSISSACTKHELYVDFEKIGWSSWIISPKGYNAFYCKGECSFPLGQNQLPTNHATVQSIVHELSLSPDVGKPCCVPNKLYSISLLYFDEQENVILKQYDDMVAASCGCH